MALRNSKGQFIKGSQPPSTAFKKGFVPYHKGTKGLVKGYWTGKKRPDIGKKISSKLKGKRWSIWRTILSALKIKKPLHKKNFILRGKEYSPYWRETRKQIYERDNWTCQECGCHCLNKEYKNKKNKIQCHHIDYNIKNNNYENLITLCASCHTKTNFNKKNWIEYYKNKIERTYYV